MSAARALADLLSRVPLLLVDLKNCHLTDSGATALAPGLAASTSLVALHLSRTNDVCCLLQSCSCGITKVGARALCAALESLPALEELDLSRQNLLDDGVVAVSTLIARSQSLTTMLLADVGMGESGSLALASGISATSAPLAVLSIADNPVGEPGFAAICAALAGRAPSPPTLRSLEVSMDRGTNLETRSSKRAGKPLPDGAAAELASLLRSPSATSLTALDISGTFEIGSRSQARYHPNACRVCMSGHVCICQHAHAHVRFQPSRHTSTRSTPGTHAPAGIHACARAGPCGGMRGALRSGVARGSLRRRKRRAATRLRRELRRSMPSGGRSRSTRR